MFKIGTLWFYSAIMHLKDADGMINNVDPDHTAPEQSDQGLQCLLVPISVPILPFLRSLIFTNVTQYEISEGAQK